MSGLLVAVVGPSGAGKDTLLAAARRALGGEAAFQRRLITRPPDPGAEDHEPVTRDALIGLREAGALALWWEAHGLLYGLPRAPLESALDEGRLAVANLSRRVLAEAARRYPLRVVEVTAPPAVLVSRLAGRGREGAEAVARRLAREAPLPEGLAVERVLNDGDRAEGEARFLAALRGFAAEASRARHAGDARPG